MTVEEALNLVDLYIDDELPMELVSEFKQLMFENEKLREEVVSLRKIKETLHESKSVDEMTEDERVRVFSRIIAEIGASRAEYYGHPRQLELPISKEITKIFMPKEGKG
ncbi:MAG TPA: hypothetical protein VNK96_00500 [Fimbriimonadales bacterium]|nr:hypothetical protein [Fimbriimonadales bacterium]